MGVLIVVIMGRWSEFSVCIVCQVVRLYSVVEIIVMSGEVACCSVVCGTLVSVAFQPRAGCVFLEPSPPLPSYVVRGD